MNGSSPECYAVHVTLAAPEGGYRLAETLWDVFDGLPEAAMPSGIRPRERAVTIEFDRLPVHPHGHTSVDDAAPDAEAIAAPEGVHRDGDAAIPIVRAALAVSAACRRAGISPRREIWIAVEPEAWLSLDQLGELAAGV
jgi:hypothetical protein